MQLLLNTYCTALVLELTIDIPYDEIDEDEVDTLNYRDEASTSVPPQCLQYQCDCCDFKTQHEVGIQIHKSKVHKDYCENCLVRFNNKEQLERHKLADDTLSKADETLTLTAGSKK